MIVLTHKVRPCERCGEPIPRRRHPSGRLEALVDYDEKRFCGRTCSLTVLHAARPIGRSRSATHRYSAKQKEPGPCEKCGAVEGRTEVHHKDWDQQNNALENLTRLCRGCHMRLHHNPRKRGF